jgi:hypothetical protein
LAGIALFGHPEGEARASGGAYRGPVGEVPPGNFGQPCSDETDLANWIFWWHAAKDEFLRDRAPVARRPEGIGKVAKALRMLIANGEIHPAIRAASVLALARAADDAKPAEILARALDPKEELVVRESAMIGLAFLEKTKSLEAVVNDAKAHERCRSFAMFAMALRRGSPGKAATVGVLKDPKSTIDLRCDAVFALGLRGFVADELLGLDGKGPAPLRARAVEALGRIAHDYRHAVQFARYSEEPVAVRRSRVVALGKRQWTKDIYFREGETDHVTLGLTAISMGWKGHTGLLRRHWEERPKLRGYIALALAIARDRTMIPTFRDALADKKGSEYLRGAFAIALGLLGAKGEDTTALLVSMLNDRKLSRRIRRPVATALGMTKTPAAKKALLDALGNQKKKPDVLRAVREGLSLLEGKDLTGPGLAVFGFQYRKAPGPAIGAASRGLGNWKDPGSVEKLLAILEPDKINGDYPDLNRQFAAEALGLIYERRGMGLLLRVTRDLNYRTTTPALAELLTYQ